MEILDELLSPLGWQKAKIPIFAVVSIAKRGCFTETVEVSFCNLAPAVDRCESFLQTAATQAVGITFQCRLTFSPNRLASDTLILHGANPDDPLSTNLFPS